MTARIFSRWGETKGLEFSFGAEATIGRTEDNTVVLGFAAVSGHHASIRFDAAQDCYLLKDLGSLNGTRVDGVRVERPMRLGRLHVITFGRVCEFIFQRLADEPPPEQLDGEPRAASS